MPDLFWEVDEPLTVKAAQDRETTGADNAHHQGSNHHDHRVDNLGGVCGYLCFEVCLFVCQPGWGGGRSGWGTWVSSSTRQSQVSREMSGKNWEGTWIMNYCLSTIFHLIKVITMTTAEAARPGIIPKGIPTTRLNNARKNRLKHLHILTDNW